MTPDKSLTRLERHFLWLIVAIGIVFMAILHIPPAIIIAQTNPGPDRLDFTAAEGQTTFPTAPVSPKPNVQVYRNGLLQRQGPNADYTQQYIQNGTRIRITFLPQPSGPVPATGHYVTLFYYR